MHTLLLSNNNVAPYEYFSHGDPVMKQSAI